MPPTSQRAIIISAMTCCGKSTLAQGTNNTATARDFIDWTGPTVGKSAKPAAPDQPAEPPLYVTNKTKVRVVNGYVVIDLDPAPYRLRAGSDQTHDWARYEGDVGKLIGFSGLVGASGLVVMVSTHDATRAFLCKRGWRYWLVYPAKTLRVAWVRRLKVRDERKTNRATVEKYIALLDNKFEDFVEGMTRGLDVENRSGARTSFAATRGGKGDVSISRRSSPSVRNVGNRVAARSSSSLPPSPSSPQVQWLEIQDASIGVAELLPFIISQQRQPQPKPTSGPRPTQQ